jgi:hypothetical protein
LEPGESGTLSVEFDPTEDLGFEGGLAIDVTGYDDGGREVFQSKVTLKVQSPDLGSGDLDLSLN